LHIDVEQAAQLNKEKVMAIANLEELFLHELKDVYDAEKRIMKALPKMAKKARDETLQAAFEEHLEVTEKQVERIEQIFKQLDKPNRGKKCPGMEGIVKEGSELLEEDEGAPLDAALIGAAQKVEHYEIASYGSLVTYAKLLEMDEAAELLGQTLAEEKETDQKLTEIASHINLVAENGREEEEAAE
jgi:ferritin-like metal-binding protein YciE